MCMYESLQCKHNIMQICCNTNILCLYTYQKTHNLHNLDMNNQGRKVCEMVWLEVWAGTCQYVLLYL